MRRLPAACDRCARRPNEPDGPLVLLAGFSCVDSLAVDPIGDVCRIEADKFADLAEGNPPLRYESSNEPFRDTKVVCEASDIQQVQWRSCRIFAAARITTSVGPVPTIVF